MSACRLVPAAPAACCLAQQPPRPRLLFFPLLLPPADQFIDSKSVFDWLDSKRTCMKLDATVEAKLGHCPQEDYAEAIHKKLVTFIEEEPELM